MVREDTLSVKDRVGFAIEERRNMVLRSEDSRLRRSSGGEEPLVNKKNSRLLRKSCESCAQAKRKCNGKAICSRCLKHGKVCRYKERKKSGPKSPLAITSGSTSSKTTAVSPSSNGQPGCALFVSESCSTRASLSSTMGNHTCSLPVDGLGVESGPHEENGDESVREKDQEGSTNGFSDDEPKGEVQEVDTARYLTRDSHMSSSVYLCESDTTADSVSVSIESESEEEIELVDRGSMLRQVDNLDETCTMPEEDESVKFTSISRAGRISLWGIPIPSRNGTRALVETVDLLDWDALWLRGDPTLTLF